jgi:hypothetical protein
VVSFSKTGFNRSTGIRQMATKRRKCGACRKPGHTRTTCPLLNDTLQAGRSHTESKDDDFAMGTRDALDKALVAYTKSIPETQRPDQVSVCEFVLEYALDMLHEASEGAGLAYESILTRLVAFNSEWANDERSELRDLAEDDEEDLDDDEEDLDLDDDEEDLDGDEEDLDDDEEDLDDDVSQAYAYNRRRWSKSSPLRHLSARDYIERRADGGSKTS